MNIPNKFDGKKWKYSEKEVFFYFALSCFICSLIILTAAFKNHVEIVKGLLYKTSALFRINIFYPDSYEKWIERSTMSI